MTGIWKTDTDGDYLYEIGHRHIALVCPHHDGFIRVASMLFPEGDFDTLEDAKAYVEAKANKKPTTLKPRPAVRSPEEQSQLDMIDAIAFPIAGLMGYFD